MEEEVELNISELLNHISSGSFIIAHNHPGPLAQPTFSSADERTTRILKEEAEHKGMKLLDHIVFTDRTYLSFKTMGLFEAYEAKGKKQKPELIDPSEL